MYKSYNIKSLRSLSFSTKQQEDDNEKNTNIQGFW